jgi:hypothetical protein
VGEAAPGYTIRARAPLAGLRAALAAEPWVVSVEQVGVEELHLTATSVDVIEQRLAPVLAEAGARLISVVPSGADLERVFLELTT